MAVANVAQWFYEQGLRVIVVDWDLEAPGLESFFVPPAEVEKVRAKPGIIDMLLAYQDRYPLLGLTVPAPADAAEPAAGETIAESLKQMADVAAVGGLEPQVFTGAEQGTPAGDGKAGPGRKVLRRLDTAEAVEVLEKELSPLAYMLYPLRASSENACGRKSALWLLSAGWRTKGRFAEYGRSVQNFSWSEFYEAYHGEAYFEWMRRQLASEELADVVIIDSRTGITEMGGVCTRQLADVVVSFTAPNFQNLMGVVRMAASFRKPDVLEARARLEDAWGGRPLEVVVVPTRIENGELMLREQFKMRFQEQLADVPAPFRILHKDFWSLRIPYVSKYAYEETLAIGDPHGSEDLQAAYKLLAAHLVLLAPEGSTLRASFSEQLRATFGAMSPRVLFLEGEHRKSRYLRRLREELNRVNISLWEESDDKTAATTGGGIDLAEHLLLPLTVESAHSETFLKQWRQARRCGVCVQLVSPTPGEVPRPEELPLWLRNVHVYDPEGELDALVRVLKSTCMSARAPFMVPELPENYVEREAEVELIVEALLKSATPAGGDAAVSDGEGAQGRRVALCGPGGFGKSTLAKAVGHDERTLAAYGDGILWVSLGEQPDVDAALKNLYAELIGELSRSPTQSGLVSALASRLEGRDCLLVVNDVWTVADLQPFLDVAGTRPVLITTRDRDIAESIAATLLPIEGMRPEESVQLLSRCAGLEGVSPSAVVEVAGLLGHVPLALKLAGATLRTRLSQSKAVELLLDGLYKEIEERGVTAFDENEGAAADTSIARSIAASMHLLTEREADHFLKLVNLPAEVETPVGRVAQLWELDEPETLKLIRRFSSLSLLGFDEGAKTVRLHRLMHSFLAAQGHDQTLLNARSEAAESLYARLTPEEQATARKVFTRLVHVSAPGEELPDRRGRYDFEKSDSGTRQLLQLLEREQLVRREVNANGEQTLAQLNDDALVHGWQRLRSWLDEDRQFLLWRQSLATRVAEWEGSKRHNTGVLLDRRELSPARAWYDGRKEDLSGPEALFVEESRRAEAFRARQRIVRAAVAAVVLLAALAAAGVFYRGQQISRQREEVLKTISETRLPETNPNSQSLTSQGASYRQAVAAYETLRNENPQSTEVLILLGDAYSGLGSTDPSAYDKAIKVYLAAIDINPDLPEPHLDLGTIYKAKADRGETHLYDSAIKEFTEAIKLKPEYAEAYLGRADSIKAKADKTNPEGGVPDPETYGHAAQDYTVVLDQLKRQDPDAYYKRGSIYKALGNNQGALADFQKVFELSADSILRDKALEVMRDLEVTPTPTPALVAPRIYIQYNDPDDELAMLQLTSDLRERGYRVIGQPQLSAGKPLGDGDVRCFQKADSKAAEQITEVVEASLYFQNYRKTILPRTLGGYPNVPQGNIEVWIASLRGEKDNSGDGPTTSARPAVAR
jgi:tetratricopeptide (TPR) repeat protein